MIAGDFNHSPSKKEVEDWLPDLGQHGIGFALHDGNVSIRAVADCRYQQATQGTGAAAEALSISSCIPYKSLGQEIDRICSMTPTCTGPGSEVSGCPPLPPLVCTEATATYVAVHARFDHGPRLAKFTLSAATGGSAGLNMSFQGREKGSNTPDSTHEQQHRTEIPSCACACEACIGQ